jgi:mono/diheme cytochrome c family protein
MANSCRSDKWIIAAVFSCALSCGALGFGVMPGDTKRGKVVFDQNCDQCHDAYSKEERVGPGLQGTKDGKLPDGRPATHDKILDVINTGPAEMTSFKDRLSEQEKEDVVAFVMTL